MNKRYTWTLFTVVAAVLVVVLAYVPADLPQLERSGTYKGMVYIPSGVFSVRDYRDGNSQAKEVTIQGFYMDQTEITNKQYREFVEWVRDSIVVKEFGLKDYELENGYLDWEKIKDPKKGLWKKKDTDPTIQNAYERFHSQERDPIKKIWSQFLDYDKKLLKYKYSSVNSSTIAQAYIQAQDKNNFNINDHISQEPEVYIYPDLTVWYKDFPNSQNDPYFENYFFHKAYNDYPVVGITWKQAKAYNHWRTVKEQRAINLKNKGNEPFSIGKFELPTVAQWQYAAEGGSGATEYAIGNDLIFGGKLVANFKAGRGNYLANNEDVRTTKVRSFFPNGYNLYDMSGNVAEWTTDEAYQSSTTVSSSQIPSAQGENVNKKFIMGGSWKDTHKKLRIHEPSEEHADSARSYIGFRSVIIKHLSK